MWILGLKGLRKLQILWIQSESNNITYFEQLLDEVFVISGIIKVEVSAFISQAKGQG